MNREIKFRAFSNNEMLVVASIGFARQIEKGEPEFEDAKKITELYCLDGIYGKVVEVETDCPLMQYTGLKDSKGVEIYEGDIVLAKAYDAENKLYIVKADVCYDTEQFIGYRIGGTRMSACFDFKVIGNIHQNSELLK